MADEAKVIFELVDRSGPGSASANPQIPGAGQVPGASLASDFHQRVSSTGLPEPGAGSAAAPAAPEVPSLSGPSVAQPSGPLTDAPQPAAATPSTTISGQGDPLLETVRQITSADPSVTAAEIQKALGIEAKRAAALMSAMVPPATPLAATVPAPSIPPTAPLAAPTPTPTVSAPAPVAAASPAPAAPSEPPKPDRGEAIPKPPPLSREQQLEESERRAPPVVQPQMPDSGEPYSKDTAQAVSGIVNGIASTAAKLGGPLGGAEARILSGMAPQLAAAAGASPSLAGFATIAGPLAAIPAGIGAGIAFTLGVERALLNEGERARSLIGGFSPEVSRAEAEADVRQIMANLRTSRRLGDEVAEIVEGRSRLSTSLQGLRDIATEGVLRDFGNVIGALAGAAENLNKFVENSPRTQKVIQESISQSLFSSFFPGLGHLFPQQLRDFFDGMNKALKKREGLDNPFQWFGSMDHVAPPDWVSGSTVKPSATEFEEIPGLGL